MDSWTRVIIEWINCLGLCEKSISDLQDLQDDTIFYSKLIRQLSNSPDKSKNDCYKVEKFIRDEYPDFILPKDEDSHTSEQVLLASLMLLTVSQNETFHKPMYSLKNDTQVLIKRFLELILPYSKNITLDSLNTIIQELGDSVSTPQTPKDRPLKTFLSSPAAQSAYRSNAINERNRELRKLRAQLETELFEKADMQEDIKTLEDKLHKLQKKLQNKSDELRSIKLERTLISTPQSTKKCHRAENTEEVLKKEVQHLESCNLKLQVELDKLQEEHDELRNKLASKERLSLTLKKTSEECEKGMETLIAQLEAKTSELLDLRMQNEDLRQHILEMQKHPLEVEQSFDAENVSGLNVSEAASSIIEVQLREAVGECLRLKTELTSLQEKLNLTVQDYSESKLQNEILNEKLIHLDEIKMNLEMAEDKLEKRDCQINILGMEKQSLQTDLNKLRESIIKKDKIIEETGEERKKLENEITTISEELNNLKISLVTTEDTLSQTIITKEVLEMKLKTLDDKIIILEQSLAAETTNHAEMMKNTDEKIRQLEEQISKHLEEKQQLDDVIEGKNKELEKILQQFNEQNIVMSTLNDKISQLDIELNAAGSALKNSETKFYELSELREELHSQLNQEKITTAKLLEEKNDFEINLSTLEDTNNELTDKVSTSEKYISRLESKNMAFYLRLVVFQDMVRREEEKVKNFREKNEELSLKIENMNTEILQLKNTNESVEKNLINSVEKIEKLENEKKISEENYKKTEEKIQNLEHQIEQFNLTINKKDFEITELEKKEKNLQINLNKIQDLNEELEKSKKMLEENSLKSVEKIQNLELDIQNKTLKIQEYNSEILKLNNDYTKLVENFQKSEKINHDLEDLKNKTEEKNFKSQEKLEILHSEIVELTSKIEAINSETCELKNIQENLQNRLTQEQESSMKLLTEKADLERALNQAEQEKLHLTQEKSILTSQLEENQQKMLTLETNYSNRNANYNEALKRLENLTSEITTLKSELDKAISNYSDLKQTHVNLNTQLHETKSTISSLTTEKSALENLVSLRDEEKQKLEEQIEYLAQDLEKSRQEIKNLSENAGTLQEQYKQEKSSAIEELNRKLTEKNAEIVALTTQHEMLQQTAEKMEENYKMQLGETQNIQTDLVKIQELLESKEKLIADYEKQEKISKEEINSLKTQLSATTTALNDVKLSLNAKIDEITAEKALTESKLEEKIEKLEEINSNQRSELDSKARTLAERELELENVKKRCTTDKTDLEVEINRQKAENKDLKEQLESLTHCQSEISQKIEDLELKLATETVELQKSREKYENLKEDTLKLLETCEKPSEATSNDNFRDPTIEKLFKNLTNIMGDLKTSQKVVSDLEEAKKTLENDLSKEKSLLAEALSDQTVRNQLEEELKAMKLESTKQNEHSTSLKTAKTDLKNLLTGVLGARDDLDAELSSQREVFDLLSQEIQVSLKGNTCDELKHLEATRSDLETKITALSAQQMENLGSLIKILCQELVQDANDVSIDEKPMEKDIKSALEAQITKNKTITEEIAQLKTKITELRSATDVYKQNLKSGTLKREPNSEEKLQAEVYRLSKEKKDMQEKLEATRARNTKMEKNLDELRGELRRLKDEKSSDTTENDEITRLTKQTEDLEGEIERLQVEKRELEKRPLEEDFDQRLREVHVEYEQKLERLKQKMKVAYSEQMEKLNADQAKALADKVGEIRAKAERQCKKYSEDIAKYKAHISDLSSQFWDVGEKLLAEKQAKEKALELVHELQRRNDTFSEIHHSTAIAPAQAPRDLKVQVIEEHTTTTRRHSVKSIQAMAMGNAFNAEDEEGEVFDSVCLTDLKEGRCRVVDSAPDFDRISELRMRNSLCQPHLKSSYAAETNFHPLPLTEEDIKGGPTSDEIFNDSLNQSLLPSQKAKKKDRTQTSYKRPGPPTPSKHGHRLSLQGNELRSPNGRCLRERISERRTTATPKRLKAFFTSATSRRQDENVLGTPKARRLSSFFRKPQPADKN